MRLDKFLADCGVGSRSELKKIIASGRVCVGGTVCRSPKTSVEETDTVLLDGQSIAYRKYVYLMMNKPGGVLSATRDKQKTVLDLLGEEWKHFDLFPVGRLDKDTVGLLLLTNHGELAHRLLSPTYKVPKVYEAVLDKEGEEKDVEAFLQGIDIGGGEVARPAKLSYDATDKTKAVVTIAEGKFHQVKRMFHAVGKEVVFLKRISFGGLMLDEALEEGTYRELSEEEIHALFEKTNL